MKKRALDFKIDKITNSIEHAQSGISCKTAIHKVDAKIDAIHILSSKWEFDWKFEINISQREVYKLTIINEPNCIHGLMSIEVKSDHVYLHLIESSSFNKGKNKLYLGVAGNLVAFACKRSFQCGYMGYVSFLSKTALVQHYESSLGAFHFKDRVMIIETKAAMKLINNYFNE